MMTSLQRYLGTLNGTPVDHLARLPILMQYAAEFIGSNYGEFASDYRVLTKANIECARFFGIDQMNTMSDPYRETQGYGAEMIYERNTVPHCLKHPLQDSTDIGKVVRPDPLKAQRMRDRIDAVRAFRQTAGDQYSIMGWVEGPAAEAGDLRTPENFFMDLYEEPVFCGELMALCVEVALEFAKYQVECGAETIGVGDALASQVSPELYEKLILPHEQRLVRGLHEMGAKVRLHICGNITHLLPGIASLDVDVIDVDHMVDLRQTRKALGKRVALGGNIDPVAGVLRGTPETIRATMLESYRQAGNPFMVNAGCEIPHGTPVENLQALCEPIAFNSEL
jgi:MtaA/CmuA family methyltransferase